MYGECGLGHLAELHMSAVITDRVAGGLAELTNGNRVEKRKR